MILQQGVKSFADPKEFHEFLNLAYQQMNKYTKSEDLEKFTYNL